MTSEADQSRVTELLAALEQYRAARERLLDVLGPRRSNRDPLAEFAEHFVAVLMGGRLAASPVQASWDAELTDGGKVQVKYLANTTPGAGAWVNEHLVRSIPGVDWYALVIIEGFQVSGVARLPGRARPYLPCPGQAAPPPRHDTAVRPPQLAGHPRSPAAVP